MKTTKKNIEQWIEAGLTEDSETAFISDNLDTIMEWWSDGVVIVHATPDRDRVETILGNHGISIIEAPTT